MTVCFVCNLFWPKLFFPTFLPEIGGGSKCLHDGLPFRLPLVAPCFGRAQVLDWFLIDKDEEKEDLTNKKT